MLFVAVDGLSSLECPRDAEELVCLVASVLTIALRRYLFKGTIIDNIRMGRRGISEEDVQNACQTTRVLRRIMVRAPYFFVQSLFEDE